ncbi:MAG: transcriptional regulator [Planctomycetota bacterium]|jgi:DNA-binding MarR family transcriptional regulator
MAKSTEGAGRYAYEGLDRVLHEKARLGIMTSLVSRPDGLVFGELKGLCNLTDGNLSRHLEVLAREGLVKIDKAFVANRPQTTCRVTPQGRKRFREYLGQLEQVLRDAQAEEPAAKPNRGAGWAPA